MEQQEEDKAELQEKKDAKQEKLSGLQDMKVELEGMKQTITAQKEQNEKDKKKLRKKEKNLKEMKAGLEDKDSSLASIEQEIKQRNRNNDSNDSGSDNSGSGSNAVASSSSSGSSESSESPSSSSSSSDDGDVKQLSKSTSSGSGSYNSAIQAGHTQTGTPYVTAGKGPGGFDCSGFVSWSFGQAGVSIPSSTAALQSVGSQVSYSSAQPGDLVFFNTYKTNGHVGIYLGNGKFLGAQNSTGVAVADMTSGYWKDKFAGHVRRVQ